MSGIGRFHAKNVMRGCMGALIGAGLALSSPAVARQSTTTMQTLLDRVQIEDMMSGYYYHLGSGDPTVYGEYYTEDFVFDVNGKIYRGQQGLLDAYHAGDRDRPWPGPRGTFHMLIGNPLIDVQGDTATARFLWTGFISDSVKGPPRLVEQGREYDVLVKRNGKWLIKKRTIISDAGLQDEFNAIYKPRFDYDPLKD